MKKIQKDKEIQKKRIDLMFFFFKFLIHLKKYISIYLLSKFKISFFLIKRYNIYDTI